MKLAFAGLIGAAGALAACTGYPPPPPPGPQLAPIAAADPPLADGCFRTREINGHQVADDHTLYIRVANRDVYRLEMAGSCLAGASSSDPLVMREPPGVPYACRPIDLDISIARGGLGMGGVTPTPCIVQSMTRLTPAEVAALPPRLRP
ncbi:DUF6491 family protein [Phenylobacterium sp. LjRoot225]|uniref:DUF6491 family protein n=1 Tax=Phenylobacterium sp. LjRoot225 TaxID=3342285 RepID=UPI003ECFA4E0